MSENTTVEPSTAPDAAPEQPAAPARRRFSARSLWQTVGPIAVFVILFAVVAVLQPAFVSGGLSILAVQATSILLVALGQAMVLHVGSIDLSNASIAIFAAILLAL